MLGLIGTIAEEDFPLYCGDVFLEGDRIRLGKGEIPVNRGTPAMIAAAVQTLEHMRGDSPFCYLVGDIGNGRGCKQLYAYLAAHIADIPFHTLTLHYFQPDVGLFKQVLSRINSAPLRPTLIADAGFMYVAKMGGDAPAFDLFTPDAGELAYLADEKAPHPFYTRGFILHEENLIPDLIKRAYLHHNAATYLLVKGPRDYIANREGIIGMVDHPNEEALEPIGGTGDTLTGIVSAMIEAGMDIATAAIKAARVNRLAGLYAEPTPATQVYDIIKQIPRALEEVLGKQEGEVEKG